MEFILWKDRDPDSEAYDEVARVEIRFVFDANANRFRVCGAWIDTSRSEIGLTASELKRFPWSRWIRAAETIHKTPQPDIFLSGGDRRESRAAYQEAWAQYHTQIQAAVGHPGSKGRDEAHYKRVAYLYQGLLADGETKPIKRLSEDLGISPNTVSTWIRKARKAGYLPETRKGRPA